MDKTTKAWVSGAAVVILIAVGYMMIKRDVPSHDLTSNEDNQVVVEQKPVTSNTTTTSKGMYLAYSADKLSYAKTGDVVLFFNSDWSVGGQALEKNIKANLSNIPAGLVILEVDYDKEIALKQKYGVSTQHTLVQVDATGKQILKWNGSATLAEIVKAVK